MEAPSRGTDLSASHQPQLYAIAIATYCLAFLAVTLRFISRSLSKSSYWLDDWLIVFALVLAGGNALVLVVCMIPNGYGKHVWTGPPNALYAYALGLFMQEILYASLICLVKFSILAFYWRIFNHVVIIRMPIYILGALVGCWGIACVLVSIFQCHPVDYTWKQFSSSFQGKGHCGVDSKSFFYGNAVPNIITDSALLILPIPFIWKLHLPTKQKLLISTIFLLGVFVIGVSITRLVLIVTQDLTSPDVTWNTFQSIIWSLVECHTAIICACLPSLRPIFAAFRKAYETLNYHESRSKGNLIKANTWVRSGSSHHPISNDHLASEVNAVNHMFTKLPEAENGDHELDQYAITATTKSVAAIRH